jgi:hypothetical protein
MKSIRNAAGIIFLFAAFSACSSDSGTGTDVIGLALSQSSMTVGVGAEVPIVAYLVHEGGSSEALPGEITWTTSNASVASVDEEGNVRGEKPGGPVIISAWRNGLTTDASVMVVPADIEITPRISTLAVGASVQFTAVPLDASGTPLEADAPVWTVSFPAGVQVASLTADGLLTVLAPGVAVVQASISGRAAQREIGVPSVYDGFWTGTTAGAAGIEFVVEYGVVSSFRFPTTIRQACTRQILSLQSGVIDADDRFSLSLPGSANVVTGTFANASTMSGAHGDIPTVAACVGETAGPIASSAFSATRK